MYVFLIATDCYEYDYIFGETFEDVCFRSGYKPWEVQCLNREWMG